MKRQELKRSIRQLVSYQNEIAQKDYYEINIELHQEVARLKSEILKSFGLPETSEYLRLLDLESNLTEEDINTIIELLSDAATSYLLTIPTPDLQLLFEAQRQKSEASEVLPLLKFKLHIYNLFVYESMLLTGKDSPNNVYEALLRANNPEVLNDLGLLASCGKLGKEEKKILKKLKLSGISYLDEYLEAYTAKNKREK